MIITLVKADFSSNNIGTLGSFAVLTNILNATYSGPISVSKGEAFNATVTMNEGYVVPDNIIISMGGNVLTDVYDINGDVITINIAVVTGGISININGIANEEDNPSGEVNEIDISNLFTDAGFTAGAIYAEPTNANFGGTHASQTAYSGNCANTAYVNIQQYAGKTLKITLPYAKLNSHLSYGIVFYTNTGKSNAIADVTGTTITNVNNSVGYEVREITIPSNAKLARTTWLTPEDEAAVGATFFAKIVG